LALKKAKSLSDDCRVLLVCADGLWGPPISGRFDSDSFDIWAVTRAKDFGSVYLQGCHYDQWNIDKQFEQKKIGSYTLHHLEVLGQDYYPKDFVLRFDMAHESFYDNNGGYGANYHITPYSGKFRILQQ
jgi:hypothetical protein